jgi:hypothetical protein
VVAKARLKKFSQEAVGPDSPKEKVEELVDASTSSSDLRAPEQAR